MPGSPQPGWQHRPAGPHRPDDRSSRVYGNGGEYRGGYGEQGEHGDRNGYGDRSGYGDRNGYGEQRPRPRPRDGRAGSVSRPVEPRPREPRAREPRGREPNRPRDPRKRGPRELDPRERRPRTRDLGEPSKRPRRRTPIWARLTLAIGAVMMLLSGTAIAGYEVLNNRYAGNVQEDNLLGAAAVDPGQELAGPLNLLMLGLDEQGEGARSDTIIVLHIPSTHDQAYLMSVPRDTYVTVPGYWDMKITDAFNVGYENEGGWGGGAQLVASVLNNLTGLRFNGASIVNFGGFQRIIDEMGGIEFCVDTEASSEHLILVDGEPVSVGRARNEGLYGEEIRYEVGCREMAGWEALDYARQRKTLASEEGDYGRQRHQVQLLQAMAAKATSSDVTTNIGTLDSLILAAGDALIVDTNGVPLADFAFTLRSLRPSDLVTLQTNRGEFQSEQVDGISIERLTPESIAMFQAAANDTMGQFIVSNPDFLAPDGPAGTPPPG